MVRWFLLITIFLSSCSIWDDPDGIKPIRISDPVQYDSDDPAIWINPDNPDESLILGTDKSSSGSLYVFNPEGKSIPEKKVTGLSTPNNVDVEYGLFLNGELIDIAVVTERGAGRLRVFQLPDMTPVDGGGILVFEGESDRSCMGIALYKRPSDGAVFAVISRKSGPSGSYLWQYLLSDDGTGKVKGDHVRSFGIFSNYGEIEAVAVDDEAGYIYYSDEGSGIRKYYADPDHPEADIQLAWFGMSDFRSDREGISIYDTTGENGYIIVSDQKANRMNIYRREGEPGDSHNHLLLKQIYIQAEDSDGNEVTNVFLSPLYPGGLFVAMSDNRRFYFYAWKQLAEAEGMQLDIVY